MALIHEQLDLVADLRLGERPALELPVADPEGAVETVVVAEVADVQRREEDEPGAVDGVLDVARRVEQLAQQLRVAHGAEHRDLVHLEAVELACLGEHLAHAAGVLGGRRAQRLVDRALVDEAACLGHPTHVPLPRPAPGCSRAIRQRRDLETELGPLALLGLRGDVPLVELHDAPGVVEADAGAAPGLERGVVEAREAAEEQVALSR